MSPSLFIPTDVLETLICLNCSNYLSIFPIYTKIDSTGALCGRCKMVEVTNFIRDEAYEGIAQYLVFPCQYTNYGCNENLTPLNLEEHEQCCRFRKFECPSKLYSKCQWTGARVDLLEHFTGKHTNLLLKNPNFEINFINSQEESYLMTYNDEVFVIKKEIDARKGIFFCSIEHLISTEESDRYSYSLKLETKDKNYFLKCPDKSTCKDEKLNSTQITADMIKERLQEPAAVTVNIQIFKTRKVSSVAVEEGPDGDLPKDIQKKDPNINWDLLAEIECPICYDFMLPPIYQCVNGHSVCEVCKENLKTNACGTCKADIKETRNFTLENMTNRLIYPCKYHKSGCLYTSPGTKIKDHEMSCEFGPHTCPISEITNCTWKENYSELASHIENTHKTNILNGDQVDCPFDKDTTSEVVYLIKYNKNIFKLCYKFDGLKFYWCVQLVGPSNVAKNYRFEIDLIDLSGSKLRCYHMGLVTSISKAKDCFKKAGKYVFAPLEQVESFVTNTLSFRVRVIKE